LVAAMTAQCVALDAGCLVFYMQRMEN